MGSPPWRYRSTVEPLTMTMSSLPSLSQSKSPIPPLMDSITYLLSLDEICGTVRPAEDAMSSKTGTEVKAGLGVALPECGMAPVCPECFSADFADCPQAIAKQRLAARNRRIKVLAITMEVLFDIRQFRMWQRSVEFLLPLFTLGLEQARCCIQFRLGLPFAVQSQKNSPAKVVEAIVVWINFECGIQFRQRGRIFAPLVKNLGQSET